MNNLGEVDTYARQQFNKLSPRRQPWVDLQIYFSESR